jgi:hypothetical protein
MLTEHQDERLIPGRDVFKYENARARAGSFSLEALNLSKHQHGAPIQEIALDRALGAACSRRTAQ